MSEIVLFPHHYLRDVHAREGEDPFTGSRPVEVVTLEDMESALSSLVSGGSKASALESSKTSRPRLGSVPVEALYWILRAKPGEDWAELELPVLLDEISKLPVQVDAGGWSKVAALATVLSGPEDEHPFYTDWYAFIFLTCSLMGRPVRWGDAVVPSPVEMALAIYAVGELRPMLFHERVVRTIAAACLQFDLWVLPEALSMAQSEALNLLRYWGHNHTADDVDAVRKRVGELIRQGADLDDPTKDDLLPDVDEPNISDRETVLRAQSLRALEVAQRVRQLHEHGQKRKDEAVERLERFINTTSDP